MKPFRAQIGDVYLEVKCRPLGWCLAALLIGAFWIRSIFGRRS